MHILGRQPLRTCRGCGCDDDHACIVAPGLGCHWVLLDIDTPTGVCSVCAEAVGYDPMVLAQLMPGDFEMRGEYGVEP